MMTDFYVRRVRLDGTKEMIAPDMESDGYNIYIDDRLDDEQAMKEYIHAVNHAKNNDFNKDSVQEIEMNAHIPEKLTQALHKE